MAITEVLFVENSTPLFDEIIAHRLGMIPLVTDLDSYVMSEHCTCEGAGCSSCQVSFECTVVAKENNTNVYSSDLVSTDPKIKPVSTKILLVKMAKNNKLSFEAYARLGLGKDHARHQAVTRASYKMYPDVVINQAAFKDYPFKGDNDSDPLVKICPKKILRWEKGELVVTDMMKCTLCEACVRNEFVPKGAITIKTIKSKFIFFIESSGALPPERVVKEGLKILRQKLDRFETLVEGLKTQA